MYKRQKLKIESQIPPDIHVNADPDLLEQALQNLASNAIKYNHDGGLIRFQLLKEPNHILMRIANTGTSIPLTDRERIFERFYRADPARSGNVEGTGLGLSLACEILLAHRGDLRVESSDDQLTWFAARIPTT